MSHAYGQCDALVAGCAPVLGAAPWPCRTQAAGATEHRAARAGLDRAKMPPSNRRGVRQEADRADPESHRLFQSDAKIKGGFVQTSADNKRMRGKFYVKRPGTLPLRLHPPAEADDRVRRPIHGHPGSRHEDRRPGRARPNAVPAAAAQGRRSVADAQILEFKEVDDLIVLGPAGQQSRLRAASSCSWPRSRTLSSRSGSPRTPRDLTPGSSYRGQQRPMTGPSCSSPTAWAYRATPNSSTGCQSGVCSDSGNRKLGKT